MIVVGGGPAGIGAALASARNGAKTILLERFGSLGGLQTQGFNASFSFIDPEIQGGVISDIIYGLKRNGGLIRDTSADTRIGKGMGGIFFDIESYKFLLDNLILEAGVKPMYHVFGASAIKENHKIKAVIIESKEGRQAVLGKVIVDTTGSADIAWKSGAPCLDEGFPRGPKKGRHSGFGYTFFFGGVDYAKLKAFRKENPEEWGGFVWRPGTDQEVQGQWNALWKPGRFPFERDLGSWIDLDSGSPVSFAQGTSRVAHRGHHQRGNRSAEAGLVHVQSFKEECPGLREIVY